MINKNSSFQGLLEFAPDAVIIINEKGEIIIVNAQTEKIFGYKRKELLGKTLEELIPNRFKTEHVKYRNLFFQNPKTRQMGHPGINLFGKRKNGEEFQVEISLSPYTTENDELWVFASVRDISDKINAQQALKRSELKFKGLLESAPDAIIIANRGGEIIIVNAQVEKLFEYKREELLGQKIEILIPSRFLPNHEHNRENFLKSPKTRPMGHPGVNLYAKKKNGEEFPVEISLSPFQTEDEGMLVYAAVRDISERLKTQQELRNIKEFVFLAESIPQLVWTTLPNGKPDFFNKRWYEYTGLSEIQSFDEGWTSVMRPEYYVKRQELFEKAVGSGEIFEFEYPIIRNDGVERWFLDRGIPMKNEAGEIIKWFGTCTDIHEMKKMGDNLLKINVDLDNFIYTASHDLKAPIANIEGLINLMEKKITAEPNEETLKLLTFMKTSIERLGDTINDLTDISRIQRNLEEENEFVNIDKALNSFEITHKKLIKEAQVIFHKDVKIKKIKFSKNNLRSIIDNLLTNAIKYKAAGRQPEIWISTYLENNCIVLKVKDNGMGFNPKQKDKLFGMFKRLHSHVDGTGIGLYIVKRIIENSDGIIEADSETGKGSVFTIYFKQ